MSCNAFWLTPSVLTIRSFVESIFLKIRSCIQVEVTQLRRELADKETQLSARTPEKEKLADDELSWLDVLSHDINENVQERINLQKALFELEDMNLHNRAELQQLDDLIMNLVITSHVSQYLYLSSYLGQWRTKRFCTVNKVHDHLSNHWKHRNPVF